MDLKMKVMSFHSTGKQRKFLPQCLFEMVDDFCDNILIGSGCKTGDWGHGHILFGSECLDKPGRIQVIRPEIMAPFGETMRFIKYPAPYFTVFNGLL